MTFLELKLPPAALLAICGGASWLGRDVAWGRWTFPASGWISATVALAGAAIVVLGAMQFGRQKTSRSPRAPEQSSSLVTSGVYRFTRNPMYLGFAAVLLGWALWLQNLAGLGAVPFYVWYLDRFQIRPEEVILRRIFGERYERYVASTRRWI